MNQWHLTIELDGNRYRYELDKAITSIGSSRQNDIVVECAGVDEVHVHILLRSDGPFMQVLSKRRNVRVNGTAIRSTLLSADDVIEVGRLKATVCPEVPASSGSDEAVADANHTGLLLSALEHVLAQDSRQEALVKFLGFAVRLFNCTRGAVFEPATDKDISPLSVFPPLIDEKKISQTWSRTIVAEIVRTRECRFVRNVDSETTFKGSASLAEASVKSLMAGPLLRDGGDIIGVLIIDTIGSRRNFSEMEYALFQRVIRIGSILLGAVLRMQELNAHIESLKGQVASLTDKEIIFKSGPMERTVRLAHRFGRADIPVLILGESGCGKELFANLLHRQSDRHEKPFVALNCAAIPESLLESQLFGHEKGAFTGAVSSHGGILREADTGTLFLDEIGDLALSLQAKFLRFLQDGTYMPVGSSRAQRVDVRIIAATHRNLDEMVSRGGFRQDLLFRLNVAVLAIPPLRERGDDILFLADYFLVRHHRRFRPDGSRAVRFSEGARKALLDAQFPGNVRELENTIQRALLSCDSDVLTEKELGFAPPTHQVAITTLKEARRTNETKVIRKAMECTNGNLTQAASLLGIDRKVLRDLMQRYEIRCCDDGDMFA